MKQLLLKLSLCAASMFLTASSFAYVDMDDRLDTLEKEMQEISERNPQNTLLPQDLRLSEIIGFPLSA